MRTIEEINKDLQKAREDLAQVPGGTTEVYSRIVGYYRSVRNWNKGKKEEYGERKLFEVSSGEGGHEDAACLRRMTALHSLQFFPRSATAEAATQAV
ncbi:MAG: anaerobic ribonucleoside-triphosphate reductase [Treponema sp.]|jgi:hypothetical protein|nr:anaerobic ribonucleoside-triphosphate reductase [Treponema sp.]